MSSITTKTISYEIARKRGDCSTVIITQDLDLVADYLREPKFFEVTRILTTVTENRKPAMLAANGKIVVCDGIDRPVVKAA